MLKVVLNINQSINQSQSSTLFNEFITFYSDTEDEDLGYFNLEDFVPSLESDDYDINSNKNDELFPKCDAEGSSKHDKKSKKIFNEVHQKDNLHDGLYTI